MSGTAVWRCLLLLLFRDATARISLPRSGELPMRTKPLIAAASAHKDRFVSSSSSCSSPDVRRRQTLKSLPNIELSCSSIWPQPLQKAISIRGGAKKAPKKNVANALTSAVQDVTPTTRMYLLGCLAIALLTMIGIPEVSDQPDRCPTIVFMIYIMFFLSDKFNWLFMLKQELLLFEPVRTFKMLQLWRPITSACHLGKVDMSMAQQVYFLIQYGQQMERSDGSAQHAVFLATQLVLLCFFCTLLGVPTLSRPLITASIYCCSRRQPMMPMEIQVRKVEEEEEDFIVARFLLLLEPCLECSSTRLI